jgi:hypothetical protein
VARAGIATLLRSHRFNSAHDLQSKLHRCAWLYNEHLPQRAMDVNAPLQSPKKWQASGPDLFVKRAVNHPGTDSAKGAQE